MKKIMERATRSNKIKRIGAKTKNNHQKAMTDKTKAGQRKRGRKHCSK